MSTGWLLAACCFKVVAICSSGGRNRVQDHFASHGCASNTAITTATVTATTTSTTTIPTAIITTNTTCTVAAGSNSVIIHISGSLQISENSNQISEKSPHEGFFRQIFPLYFARYSRLIHCRDPS
jgi:hypothetical protein